jgi:hypothetical protein
LKLLGDIHSLRCTNSVVDTIDKWKKSSIIKSFNYFVWTPLGSTVELTYWYIFALEFNLRSLQPDIVPIIYAGVVDTGGNNTSEIGGKFAAVVIDTGGKFAAGVIDIGGNKTSDTGGKNLLRVLCDTGSKFASGVFDTGDKFAAGIVDTGGKFATGIVDTGGKFAAGIVDTGGKFAAGIVDTGGKFATGVVGAPSF